ncbi:single-stranded DNA-binding protein [Sphingobacterium spiritivorum]|uniref:single-stranded DNA-binding protein n=1 Tax=Sphingobacterium spiritivorum TaxID=258 RepID=UPI003DA22635
MEITGRLTADSTVKTIGENRQVVNFSIAINDSYQSKDGERKEVTTYVECAFWRGANRAQWLKKGALVQLTGRIGINAYTNRDGKAVAKLTFHINDINILVFAKRQDVPVKKKKTQKSEIKELPEISIPF